MRTTTKAALRSSTRTSTRTSTTKPAKSAVSKPSTQSKPATSKVARRVEVLAPDDDETSSPKPRKPTAKPAKVTKVPANSAAAAVEKLLEKANEKSAKKPVVGAKPVAKKRAEPRISKVEPFEREVVDYLRDVVMASVKRKAQDERRISGIARSLCVASPLARGVLFEAGEALIAKKAYDRELLVAALRGLGELGDRRASVLVKAAADHDECATAALCSAAWLSDASLAPVLNKAATQRSAHIAFTAELARVIRGESPGDHLRGLAPKIKESHRIALCAEVLVPIARILRVLPGVQPALEVLRDAERHLGRWLVMAEVSVHGGDPKPVLEAREKSNEGPSGARAAWAYVAWALDPKGGAPSARPTTELVARLSDRPSADRDTKFLFRLAQGGVRTTKQLLETFARDLPKFDDDAVRAAGYLIRDHGREDLFPALVEQAKSAPRDDLRGLAVAALWDAGKRDVAKELALGLVSAKAGLASTVWGAMVLLAETSKTAGPVAHEPVVRWMQAGWLE